MIFKTITKYLLFLFVICLGFSGAYAQDPPGGQGDPPTSKFGGLQISRTDLIKQIVSSDSSFVFKETGKVDGMPIFSATSINGAHVEIIGTENNMRQAKWTMLFSKDGPANRAAFIRIGYFLTLVCLLKKEVLFWYNQQLESLLKMVSSSDPTPTASTVINADTFTCTYLKAVKGISVTVTD